MYPEGFYAYRPGCFSAYHSIPENSAPFPRFSQARFPMTQQSKIRLLIADDHDVVRSGLKEMLGGTDIKVVGEASTGQAAVEYVLKNEVDVVLLDVRMPDGDGLNALGRIRLVKPNLPILMFSYVDSPPYRAARSPCGANGYLMKDCARDELVSAINTAAAGNSVRRSDASLCDLDNPQAASQKR